MLPEKLKALLKLISQTGDRLIIFDPSAPEESFVLMDLAGYQRMLGREDQAISKSLANNSIKQAELLPVTEEKTAVSENLTEEDLTDKINREISMWKNGVDKPYATEEDAPRKAWQIPAKVKDNAQEVAA